MNNLPAQYSESTYIFFSIGTFNYAFDTKHVLDIMQLVELEYPEMMSDFILGLLEYGSKVIKIVDIRGILNLERKKYDLNSKIIVLRAYDEIFGIAVDDIKEIRRITNFNFNKVPYKMTHSLLEAIYTEKDFSASIINIANVVKKINASILEADKNGLNAQTLLPSDNSSKEILHRRKFHYAAKMKNEPYEIIKSRDAYITFFLDEATSCTKIKHVGGFYKFSSTKIIKVPNTPDYILGIANIKSRYVTVIDLLKYTENKTTKITKDSRIILLEYEESTIGIITGIIGETIDLDEGLVKFKNKSMTGCLNECVIDDNLYLFLDTIKLFGDEKLYVA